MALFYTNKVIDSGKLKVEIESSNQYKVVYIIPKIGATNAEISVTLLNGNPILDGTQTSTVQALIDAHISSQRKRVLIHDLPDLGDAAGNKTYIDQQIANLIDSSPETLNTLNELAAALGDDPNFATTVSNQIGALDTRLDAAELDIDNLQSADITINGRLTAAENDIDALQLADISLDGRLDTAELEIDTLQTDVTSLDGRLDTAESNIISLDGRLDTAELNITSLDGRLDTAELNITSLDGRLDTAELDIDNLQSDVISLDGRVDALEAANQNYGIDDLGDVQLTSLQNGQILKYNSTLTKWVNSDIGLTSLNGSSETSQTFQSATTGTDFSISTAGSVHTFSIPDASATARGVITTGTQTIAGTKTFSSTITGSISGNAGTATTLQTARTINDVSFNGSANITVTANTTNAITFNNSGSGVASGTTFNGSTARTISYNTIGAIPTTEKGVANGVATLDSSGFVTSSQLPSFVDDVLEYANLAAFPVTGESGKIYVALDTAKVYRWTGTVYIQVNSSVSSADTATKLATARNISATGDASWTVLFDGSADVSSGLTLANSGVSAGTYTKLTVDAKGRATVGALLSDTDIPNLDASKINSGTFDTARIPTNISITGTSSNVTGVVAIANGGTGQSTAQTGINALTQVSSATNEHVLTKDTSTGNAIWKVSNTGSGTTNYLTKWSGTNALTNSLLFDDGTYLGLGTTAPDHKLDIRTNGNDILKLITSSTLDGPVIRSYRSRGTNASPTATLANDVLGGIRTFAHTGTDYTSSTSGAFDILASENTTTSASGTYSRLRLTKPTTNTLSEVQKISTSQIVNTLNDVISFEENATVTTTDATLTTLYSFTLADNTTYMFDANIAARRTNTSAKGCVGKLKFGAYRFSDGSATLIADYSGAIEEIDTYGSSLYDFSVSVSGTSVLIRVTGAASETVKWVANVRAVQVS